MGTRDPLCVPMAEPKWRVDARRMADSAAGHAAAEEADHCAMRRVQDVRDTPTRRFPPFPRPPARRAALATLVPQGLDTNHPGFT